MISSGATGTVAETRSTASDLASPASAPNNTSRAPGQPPARARTTGQGALRRARRHDRDQCPFISNGAGLRPSPTSQVVVGLDGWTPVKR